METPRATGPLLPSPRARRVALAAVAAALLSLAVVALVLRIAGGSWYVVESASMGRAAPVGSLLIDVPAGAPRVGQIVTFHPPSEPRAVYSHRVARIAADGSIATRGDSNGSGDPWTLHGHDLVGRVAAVLPGLGWLARSLPLLIGGLGVLWLASGFIRSRPWRSSVRTLGTSTLVSVLVDVLRPLKNVQLIDAHFSGSSGRATVVSTGLLPVRVSAPGGPSITLTNSVVGVVDVPSARSGQYQLLTVLDLPWPEWVLLALACAVPLVLSLGVSLPTWSFGGGHDAVQTPG